MKSLVSLTEQVLLDSGTRCGANPHRDIKTVMMRTEQEGSSFLTITLPELCQAFERALDTGLLTPSMTPAFSWSRRGLPKFLQGFLGQVFSPGGKLRDDPSIEAIFCVRQILLLHKKILSDCTEGRNRKAMDSYRACENEVEAISKDSGELSSFESVGRIVVAALLDGVPFGDPYLELRPKHGPGATVEHIRGNRKYVLSRWHSRLEPHFPYSEFGIAAIRNTDSADPYAGVDFVEPCDEPPVRVVFVPKTQKTPRVIAIEPVCMQYMQQALSTFLVSRIEACKLTGGRVNFARQSVNQKLSLSSSSTREYATLDMKEASDRVSFEHVRRLFSVCPTLFEQIDACRSRRAALPNGEILTLAKFASMGSALCFPVESLAFFCAIVSIRIQERGLQPTARNVRIYARDVYVYGDDLVVPADEAPSICAGLEALGFLVNRRKSFWNGKFRESCGVDAYDGVNVTPTYIRHKLPSDRRDASAVVSLVAAANQFYMTGFWRTARYLRATLEKVVGVLPFLREGSQGLHWVDFKNSTQFQRWNNTLMRYEIRTVVPSNPTRQDRLDGDPALLKCFGVIGTEANDREHLERSGVRGVLALKRRWVPGY